MQKAEAVLFLCHHIWRSQLAKTAALSVSLRRLPMSAFGAEHFATFRARRNRHADYAEIFLAHQTASASVNCALLAPEVHLALYANGVAGSGALDFAPCTNFVFLSHLKMDHRLRTANARTPSSDLDVVRVGICHTRYEYKGPLHESYGNNNPCFI